MKKNLSKWLALLLACLMMLASCGGDEPTTPTTESTAPEPTPAEKLLAMNEADRAVAFYEYVGNAMNLCSSFTVEGTGGFSGKISGYDMDVSLTILEKFIGNGETIQQRYSKSNTILKMDGELVSDSDVIYGFYDGKMFRAEVENGEKPKVNGLYSEISGADYLKYMEETAADNSFDPAKCTNRTCVQNADKSWTAVYKDLASFEELEALGNFEDMFAQGADISNFEITIQASENMIIQSMMVSFSIIPLSSDTPLETAPTYHAELKVKDIGTTKAESVPFAKYEKISDLRIAERIEAAYNRYMDSPSGSYTAKISISNKYGNVTQLSGETDTVEFQNKDGKLTFILKAIVRGVDEEIYKTYADGELLTEYKDGRTVVRNEIDYCTDAEVRRMLSNNINPSYFKAMNISNIETVDAENGVYKFRITNPNTSILPNEYDIETARASIEITFKDGKLIKADYSYVVTANHDVGNSNKEVKVTIHSVVTFN